MNRNKNKYCGYVFEYSKEKLRNFTLSKKYESILIKTLGSSPKLRIIDFFLDNQDILKRS